MNEVLPDRCEVVIVGGGAIGLFAALFLARAGIRCLVLDAGAPWAEASAVNAGSLAVQNKRLPLVPLAIAAQDLWAQMHELLGRDVGFHRTGGYRVATSARERALLEDSAEQQERAGLDLEWVNGAALERRAPYLSRDVIAATYCALDAHAIPLEVGPALRQELQRQGALVVGNTPVRGIDHSAGEVRVHSQRGSVKAEHVVIATGAWLNAIPVTPSIGELPVTTDVNMVSVTDRAPPVIDHVVTHIRGILTLKQVQNGTCLIGGGWQGRGDLQSRANEIDYSAFIANVQLACRIVPQLDRLNLVRVWAGFEGVTPDSLPIFGRPQGAERVVVCACARGGWTLSPLLGRAVSDLVRGYAPEMDMSAFSPMRFTRACA